MRIRNLAGLALAALTLSACAYGGQLASSMPRTDEANTSYGRPGAFAPPRSMVTPSSSVNCQSQTDRNCPL